MGAPFSILGALLAKHFTDVVQNLSVFACCVLPVVFVALFDSLTAVVAADPAAFTQFLAAAVLVFVSGMVPCSVTLTPMSEERDKHTLRTLLLAKVGMAQIVASRGIVAAAVVALVTAGCYIVIGAPLDILISCTVIGIAGSLPLILFSLALGIVARDQMNASLYGMPLVFLGILPMFFWFSAALTPTIPFLPTGGAFSLIDLAVQGQLFTFDAVWPALSTLIWTVLGATTLAAMLKRTSRSA